jgi:YjjG family noncanonical pyrimidine nucleotidase
MKPYDWLLFDLDNTILDFTASSEIAFHALMAEIGYLSDHEDFMIYRQINRQVWTDMESGKINHSELKTRRWTLFFAERQIEYNPIKANSIYFEYIKTSPVFVSGAQSLLEVCKSNYKMCIITNGLSEVQWPRIEKMNLIPFFEHIVISDELGIAKPHYDYFDHCHGLIGRPDKSKVLVIGDTAASDISGAKAFGYDACWYNPEYQSAKGVSTDFLIRSHRELAEILSVGD